MTRRGAELLASRSTAGEPDVSGWGPPPKGASGMAESRARMARVLGQSSCKWSCRQHGTRAWGLGSGNEPIGRTKSPRARRAARGWAGLPVPLTTRRLTGRGTTPPAAGALPTSGAGWVGRFVFHAIAVSFDNQCLPVMHQPVDQGRGQGVVHIKEGAPFPEGCDSWSTRSIRIHNGQQPPGTTGRPRACRWADSPAHRGGELADGRKF